MTLADFFFGRPLATEEEHGQRVGSLAGIGVLGLDALASAAYGPEALLTVLLPLGVVGLRYLPTLTLMIVVLLVIVALSYRQTIDAYPSGGGAYTVAKENLGTSASLFAAAALGLDYILNVAVAISAGVGAFVSAVPRFLPHTLPLCLGVLLLLTLLNLRGVRTTGVAFMVPTYVFVGSLFIVIAAGVAKTVLQGGHPVPVVPPPSVPATLTAALTWLLVRAFANGCTAMTGVEAVSNGVPIFREPSTVRARRTLTAIIAILIALLGGVAFLCRAFAITATPPGQPGYQSVLSSITSAVFGRGAFYGVTIASVVIVLALSANTSFADFPRVCRVLAADKFLPEAFAHRGRRLVFSHGILALAIVSGILLIVFGGITDALIPLFAIGALCAFTMSQAGMVAHWRKREGAHAKRSLVLNALGAVSTAVTTCIVLASKFTEGAWISILLVAGMIVLLRRVRHHRELIDKLTCTADALVIGPLRPPIAVIAMRRWDAVAVKAIRFALGFAGDVVAVQVLTGDEDIHDLTPRWGELVVEPAKKLGITPPKLIVRRSEFRQLFAPLLDVVLGLEKQHPERQVAVIVPELIEPRWYHYVLHNRTASVIKALLIFRGGPQIVVVTAPWYLPD